MTLLEAHRAGSHDEALVSGCKVCDAALAGFLQFGTWTSEQEAKARDESPDPSWSIDGDGYVTAVLINQGLLDG